MKQILLALTVTVALLGFTPTADAQHHDYGYGHVSHHYAPHSYGGHGYFGHGGGHGYSYGHSGIGFNTGHVYGHDYHGYGHGHVTYLGGHYSHHSTYLGVFH